MRKAGWVMTAAVALLVAGGAWSVCAGDEAAPTVPATTNVVKQQTLCPVMGEPINKKVFSDYQGKRVYFCCTMCPAEFKKDPEKYIKKMEAEGITLDKAVDPKAKAEAAP